MKNIQDLHKLVLNKAIYGKQLRIKGDIKTVKAVIRLTCLSFLKEQLEYTKVYFVEDGYLYILLHDHEIYYSSTRNGECEGITNEMIGRDEIIHYQGKEYKLQTKDDYQFVLELVCGNPLDIEGECRFSDYYPTDGSKDFLSLGWLAYNNERADLHPELIKPKEIQLL